MRLHVAPTVSHPELSKLVLTNGLGTIVILFAYEPIPISADEVLVVTENDPPTALLLPLILIGNW